MILLLENVVRGREEGRNLASIQKSIEHVGQIFSAEGIFAYPKKVESVHEAGPRTDANDVCSLLGLATLHVSRHT